MSGYFNSAIVRQNFQVYKHIDKLPDKGRAQSETEISGSMNYALASDIMIANNEMISIENPNKRKIVDIPQAESPIMLDSNHHSHFTESFGQTLDDDEIDSQSRSHSLSMKLL